MSHAEGSDEGKVSAVFGDLCGRVLTETERRPAPTCSLLFSLLILNLPSHLPRPTLALRPLTPSPLYLAASSPQPPHPCPRPPLPLS